MANLVTRDTSLIHKASHVMASFYAKQPILAFITTVALPLIAFVGYIFYRRDVQHLQACIGSIEKTNLSGAEESASKIYFNRIRDKAYERLSNAYMQKQDFLNARLIAERITDPKIKSELSKKMEIKKI
jgi:hypothetical protein